MKLHEVWLGKKARLAGAGTADNEHILVAGVLRILRPAVHGERFRSRENDILIGDGIDVRQPLRFQRLPFIFQMIIGHEV